ncbi:MAG TPA: hypothetical protein VIM51_05355 [Desulfosporosinus sp.]
MAKELEAEVHLKAPKQHRTWNPRNAIKRTIPIPSEVVVISKDEVRGYFERIDGRVINEPQKIKIISSVRNLSEVPKIEAMIKLVEENIHSKTKQNSHVFAGKRNLDKRIREIFNK